MVFSILFMHTRIFYYMLKSLKQLFSLKVSRKYCSSWMKSSTQNASKKEELTLVVTADTRLSTWQTWRVTLKQITWLTFKLRFLVCIVQMFVRPEVLWECTWKDNILIVTNKYFTSNHFYLIQYILNFFFIVLSLIIVVV